MPPAQELLNQFERFLQDLEGPKKRPLSAITIKNYVSDVRKFLNSSLNLSNNNLQIYLENLKQDLPLSSYNRHLASIRRFATFMQIKHNITLIVTGSIITENGLNSKNSSHQNNDKGTQNTRYILSNFRSFLQTQKLSHSTVKNYTSDLNHYLTWSARYLEKDNLQNSLPPKSEIDLNSLLTRLNLKTYSNYLKLTQVGKSVINRRLSAIKKFTSFALADNLITHDPFYTPRTIKSLKPLAWFTKQDKPQEKLGSLKYLYQTYNSWSFTPYLHLSLLVLFTTALGLFGYNQIVKQAPKGQAYPNSLNPPTRQLSFQGRLTDSSDNPITTSVNVIFKLFNAVTSGSELYSSSTCSVSPDQDGIFNVLIGDTVCGAEIPSSVFSENTTIWLEVTVGAETLTPRQQIATVAYALNAETLQGYPPGTVANSILYIDNSGNIGIGATSPTIDSTAGTFKIQGQALTLATATNSDGNITLQPDGTGQLLAIGGTTSGSTIRITNANLTSGDLISGYIGNGTATGNLISLSSGTSETNQFTVSRTGTGYFAGNVGIGTTNPGYKLEVSGGDIYTSGDLRVAGDDLFMATNTDAFLLIADGTNFNPVAMSGDIAITNTGATSIGDDKVTEADLKAVNAATDEYCLTYETTTGDFEWQTCASGAVTGSGTDNYIVRWDAGGTGLENGTLVDNATSGISFNVDASNNVGLGGTSANTIPSLYAAAAGNIGIGTTNPGYKLEVSGGDIYTSGDLRVAGDDLFMATNTDAFLLIADGTNFNPVAMSGDIAITNTGATSIGDDKVTEADLKAVNAATDEDFLTYEATTGDFEWHTAAEMGLDNYASWTLEDDDTNTYSIVSGNVLKFTSSDGNILTDLTNGDDADENMDFSIRLLKDAVAGVGLSGGADDVLVGADGDVTFTFDPTELGDLTWGSGSPFTWTLNTGATDPSIYSTSNIISLMNSNIGIGMTNPGVALDVVGAITATGAMTALDFICTDCLDFENLEDTLNLDTSTDLQLGNYNLTFNLTGTGMVGIGTTNPTQALNVEATDTQIKLTDTTQHGASSQYATFGFNDSGSNSLTIATGLVDDANAIYLAPGGSTAMTLLGNGKASITDTLTVDGTVLISTGSITDSTGTINFGNENLTTTGALTANTLTDNTTTFADTAWTSTSAIAWDIANSSTTSLNIESGLLNLDTQNSMVGIGTTSPSVLLDVNGNAKITGTFTSSGGAITLGGGSDTVQINSSNWKVSTAGAATGLTGITSSGTINLSDLTASRAIFSDASKNLVSTATSSYLLNSLSDETGTGVAVFGTSPTFTTDLTTPKIIAGSASTADINITANRSAYVNLDYDSEGTGVFYVTSANGGTELLKINAAVPSFTVSFLASDTLQHYLCTNSLGAFVSDHSCTTSSLRYKENIEEIPDALTVIDKLRGVRFNWKPEYGGYSDIGFIAEEIGQIYPQLVEWEDDGVTAKTLSYDQITALNLQGIKEQQLQINNLSTAIGSITLNGLGDVSLSKSSDGQYITFNLATSQPISSVAVFAEGLIANFQAGVAVIQDLSVTNLLADTLTALNINVKNINVGEKLISPIAYIEDLKVDSLTAETINAPQISKLEQNILDLTARYSTASAILSDLQAQAELDLASSVIINEGESPNINAILTPMAIITDDLQINNSLITNLLNSKDEETLFVQPLANAPINLMAGLLVLTQDGHVVINGDLAVTGKILAQQIQSLQVDLENLSAKTATISALTTDKLIIATAEIPSQNSTASSSAQTTSNTIVNSATLPKGTTELIIMNTNVTQDTYVYLTPTSSTSNQTLYVKSKQEGQFTIAISQPIDQDITFNYWLIQTSKPL